MVTDFPNKIFTIVLVFLMLVVAPLLWVYVRGEMVAQRLVLNEVTQFLDKVTDKGFITQEDLDDLYYAINASGGTYDVRVRRYVRMSTQDENGETRTLYLNAELNGQMNQGDVVKVTVEELGTSPTKRLLWSILRVDEGKTKFSLAAAVR